MTTKVISSISLMNTQLRIQCQGHHSVKKDTFSVRQKLLLIPLKLLILRMRHGTEEEQSPGPKVGRLSPDVGGRGGVDCGERPSVPNHYRSDMVNSNTINSKFWLSSNIHLVSCSLWSFTSIVTLFILIVYFELPLNLKQIFAEKKPTSN